ncbi:MAG TPA: PAS domain-containing sensor histidine kinase [Cyanobacteria bacterium UBA11372]|nr:PAS domain-containing sensor histidine kinase [Cyanobacteria bacterium UBA11372]
MQLPRALSPLENLGFSFTGLLVWQGTVATLHSALGVAAIWVWLPGTIAAIMLNLQLKRFGSFFPDISGGTPNYTTRLLRKYPFLGVYAASGYFFSWAALIPINAIVLTELIKLKTEAVGIPCPEMLLKFGLTLIPFILAFSGTRALALLHLFFMIPAVGFLLVFAVEGIGWLALSPDSPGLLPPSFTGINLIDWNKWYYIAIYAVYASEGGAAFVADARKPNAALRCLSFTAGLLPIVYIGGSWVVMRLATNPGMGEDAFLNLVAASLPFWGRWSSFLVTLLIGFNCLLSSATTVSLCARTLYQLGRDGYAAPVFGAIAKREVLAPALAATLAICLGCLIWGNVVQIILISGSGYIISIMAFHLGIWLNRKRPETRWPWWSLGLFCIESIVLVVGGLAWNPRDFILGLLIPLVLVVVNAAIARTQLAIFQPQWWEKLPKNKFNSYFKDFLIVQVNVLIILVCGATIVGWIIRSLIDKRSKYQGGELLVVLVLIVSFIAVAIACWTSLPQVVGIVEARQKAERLFTIARDGIVVVNEKGIIQQTNQAALRLFEVKSFDLLGHYLAEKLPKLGNNPENWLQLGEQTLQVKNQVKTLEVSISERTDSDSEYVVILRDISYRIETEEALRKSALKLQEQAQELEKSLQEIQQVQLQLIQSEKMSSLGNLVAGIAHEINNPVGFISGNIEIATVALHDLINHLRLYQEKLVTTDEEIEQDAEEIDLEYILEDLPKMLSSMKVGCDRIRNISTSLRTFSRADTTNKVSANIHEGLDSTLMILSHRLKANETRPEIQIVKEYGNIPTVKCYLGQLNQVFMNILANAIDALEESTQGRKFAEIDPDSIAITIKTEMTDDNQNVVIKIKDNGKGMSESVKSCIFEHLFTTKCVGKGTGLGLSISRQIVEETHGGSLTCESVEGKWTEFAIALPIE